MEFAAKPYTIENILKRKRESINQSYTHVVVAIFWLYVFVHEYKYNKHLISLSRFELN